MLSTLCVPIVVCLTDWLTDWLILVLCTCVVVGWFGCFKREWVEWKSNLRVLSIWLSLCGIIVCFMLRNLCSCCNFHFSVHKPIPNTSIIFYFSKLSILYCRKNKEICLSYHIFKNKLILLELKMVHTIKIVDMF